jgi:hypothetical protein
MVLNMAQTWHQVRPGEARYDCGGCHAHTKAPLAFETTVSGQDGHPATNLGLETLLLRLTEMSGTPGTVTVPSPSVTVEYFRDVRPILTARCAGCHTDDAADGKLNLHADGASVSCGGETWPGTYYRLAVDGNGNTNPGCAFGLGTPAGTPSYFIGPQQTRYIRGFQSRESLLFWKIFGQRLDGRSNATRTGDIDFAPDATHGNRLSFDEKATLVRWVDLGAPIDLCSWPGHGCGNPTWGWFEDDLRPTLWVSPTVAEARQGPVSAITVAAHDLESGLKAGSLWVSLSVPIGGQPAGTNLAAGLSPANGDSVAVPLPAPTDLAAAGTTMIAGIRDNAGHVTRIVRTFSGGGPSVQTISPTSGPATGGTAVEISGGVFESGAAVSIGGAGASGVSVPASDRVNAATPPLSAGTLNDVAVVNAGGGGGGILPAGYLADFLDVPAAHMFHRFVETIFRRGVTSGCGGGRYCAEDAVLRSQMAVFLLRAAEGESYRPPAATGLFADVPASDTYAPWIEEVYRRGITKGCQSSPLRYCPGAAVNRAAMSVFLLRGRFGAGYLPPAAAGLFADVPAPDSFARWIEDLYTRGITAGCAASPLQYCPGGPSTRGQMAVFLTRTFGLSP